VGAGQVFGEAVGEAVGLFVGNYGINSECRSKYHICCIRANKQNVSLHEGGCKAKQA
jgi:hypothetical protein